MCPHRRIAYNTDGFRVLIINVVVGEDTQTAPWYDVRTFEATARYTQGPDEELGWVARCAEVGERGSGPINVSYSEAGTRIAQCISDELASAPRQTAR